MSATIDDSPGWARELLANHPVAHLGLLDDEGRPRVLPIAFALHEGALWTAIDEKPKRHPGRDLARLRFLRRRPEVAIAVDRYEDDWERLAWVQVLGEAAVLEASASADALTALAGKYTQYRSAPPPGPLIRIEPRRLLCWRASPQP